MRQREHKEGTRIEDSVVLGYRVDAGGGLRWCSGYNDEGKYNFAGRYAEGI